jgi:predicted transcriptional regulator
MEISNSIEIMKSLADASRLRVLNALLQKPQYVEELANRLGLAESTVSFHLRKLEGAKLVRKVKEQYYVVYHPAEEILNLSLLELIRSDDVDEYLQEERMEKYRQKVLKAFMHKGKLEKLPVQWKKRMIILEEFKKNLLPGKSYTEKEINDCILPVYGDYCTIRRLLIEEGMMERDKQIYRLKTTIEKGNKHDR